MSGCTNCSGDCEYCGGCAGQLTLNEGELNLMRKLAQFSFLPVARRADSVTPIYCGDEDYTPAEYSLILQCLEKKMLISIDLDAPLKGFTGYGNYPIRGSIALTARGQEVLDVLDIQGFSD